MAVIVDPGMQLPVLIQDATSEANGAMVVTFAVPVRNWQLSLSISLCIRVTIGGLTVKIYYNKRILATGQTELFESILPVGAEILEAKALYTVAYPE